MKTKLLAAASAAAICYTWLTAASATHFEGVYIGLHGGAGIADADYVHFQPLIGPLVEPLSFSDSAPVGGAQLGVRFDIGPDWILGLEGTYTAGSMDDTVVSTALADRRRTFEVSDQFTAVVQLGHSWGDWLVYLKGGYANAQIDIQSNVISTGLLTSTSSDRESGWTAGVGIDHQIAPNMVLGLSYDYSSYSPDDRFNVDTAITQQHHRDIEADVHLVTARLSWTF
jgi:opacity protein-like surface antigen